MAVPQPLHYFLIRSRMNGLYLDIEGGNRDPKAHIHMWSRNGADNQQWYTDPSTGTIRSKMNSLCIDLDSEKLVTNTVQQGDANQQWEISGQQIRNRMFPNKVLDVIGRNMENGAHVGSYDFNGGDNQCWEYEITGGQAPYSGAQPPYSVGASTYCAGQSPYQQQAPMQPRREFQILSEFNEKAVDISGDNKAEGAKIVMYDSHGKKNQLWYVDPQGFIRSSFNDMVFFAEEQGHPLTMIHYNGDPRQQWKFDGNKVMNGQGACMDIRGASHSNGAELCAYKYNNASNQHWKQHFV